MKNRWTTGLLGCILVGAAACGDAPSDEGVVARVAGYALSVDDVAELLVNEERLPATRTVVERIAELWIDYTLLGASAARDSTFSSLDFGPLVRRQLDQRMIFQLRDSVIQVDTVISDAELRTLYEGSDPELEIRARHILLAVPQDAPVEQRDAARDQLMRLRARIVAGESFDALARQFSADRGSAQVGGDLGFFGRGDMVAPFEEAVLALAPGQLSEPVETQFGFHLIRLEQLRSQGFQEIAGRLRTQLQTERFLSAESTYVASLEERAAPEPVEGAFDIVRELARDPGSRLSSRAGRRDVFGYEGGALSVLDVQSVLQAQSPEFRGQVIAGADAEIERFLRGLVQRELLASEAVAAGLEPPKEEIDSLVSAARQQLKSAAASLGLTKPDQAPGEDIEPAVARAVLRAIGRVLTGGADIVELGVIGYQLRGGDPAVVYAVGVGEAVLGVGQRRANRSPSLLEEAFDTTQAADSASR